MSKDRITLTNTNFRKVNLRMIEKLRQLKKKSQMTNQQIAEKSSIPESTVARIFSGKTPNPTITTVISMARAMGGSAADLLSDEEVKATQEHPADCQENGKPNGSESSSAADGDESPSEPEHGSEDLLPSEELAPHIKIYEDMMKLYKDELRKKDAWIARLFWCLAAIVAFLLFVLVFDILNPALGFVKY